MATHKQRKPKDTPTRKLLREMLKENTGRHMLDSGGAYGRNWERNQKRDFDKEPAARLEIENYSRGAEISVHLNLYHFLLARLVLSDDARRAQKDFDRFAKLPANDDKSWDENMSDFVKARDGAARFSFYTYNDDNFLDQDFIACGWTDKNGNDLVFIQIHGGCDARGGFTAPKVFAEYEEMRLYDYNSASICCENRHYWDYEPGYYGGWRNDDNLPALESFDVVNDGDAGAPDYRVLLENYKECAALNENGGLLAHAVASPVIKGSIVIDADKRAHCPICGGILSAYPNEF